MTILAHANRWFWMQKILFSNNIKQTDSYSEKALAVCDDNKRNNKYMDKQSCSKSFKAIA